MLARLGKRAATIALMALAACQDHSSKEPVARAVIVDSSGGDVSQFSLMQNAVGWLTDSNIVSLASVVNEGAISLARAESQAWTDEQTHQFALLLLRDHAALQSSLDSLAARHKVPSQAPAVAAEFHARYDSLSGALSGLPASEIDPKFLTLALQLHDRTILDFGALAGNTTDPDLKALLAIRGTAMEQQHVTRLKQLAASLAVADSAKQSAKAQKKP